MKQNSRLQTPVAFPKTDDEWHSFLRDNIQNALAVREFLDSLPDTQATFKLKRIDGLDMSHAHLPRGILKIMGSWQVPRQLSNGRSSAWVNPSYQHAQHYSDALVECGCGIPVLRESFSENEKQPTHHQEHNGSCNKIMRSEARVQLLKNRRDIIVDGYEHNQSLNALSTRLGYKSERPISNKHCADWGIDLHALMQDSREQLARTCMVLCREYPPSTVGEIYDMDKRTVSQIVDLETEASAKKMYSIRRAVTPV